MLSAILVCVQMGICFITNLLFPIKNTCILFSTNFSSGNYAYHNHFSILTLIPLSRALYFFEGILNIQYLPVSVHKII